MTKSDLDTLRLAYKKAIDEWVDTIRAEGALATPDHSMVAMEHWDAAHFKEHDAHTKPPKLAKPTKTAFAKPTTVSSRSLLAQSLRFSCCPKRPASPRVILRASTSPSPRGFHKKDSFFPNALVITLPLGQTHGSSPILRPTDNFPVLSRDVSK